MVLAFGAVAISAGQRFPFDARTTGTRYRDLAGFGGPAIQDGIKGLDLIG